MDFFQLLNAMFVPYFVFGCIKPTKKVLYTFGFALMYSLCAIIMVWPVSIRKFSYFIRKNEEEEEKSFPPTRFNAVFVCVRTRKASSCEFENSLIFSGFVVVRILQTVQSCNYCRPENKESKFNAWF